LLFEKLFLTLQRKALLIMDKKEVFSTLNEIRNLMEKSSKILSLSGISAVYVGVYACLAAVVSCYIAGDETSLWGNSIALPRLTIDAQSKLLWIICLALCLIVLCLATAFFFAYRKARRNNQRFVFDRTARRLLWNFFVPMIAGGILCIALIVHQQFELISSMMLIFYGIALINISNYTYSNTRYLGYAELLLGLANCFVVEYSLLCWTLGFGVFHILYGFFFYLKYDRKKNVKQNEI
jgi:hypothetical protein